MCVALTTSLTLLLPGEYYQNTSSHYKQKNNHNDGWSEDVLNHVQAARKESLCCQASQGEPARSRAAGSCCGVQGLPITAGMGWSGCQLGVEQSKPKIAEPK